MIHTIAGTPSIKLLTSLFISAALSSTSFFAELFSVCSYSLEKLLVILDILDKLE